MSDDVIKDLKHLANEYEKNLSDIRDKIRILDAVPKAQALVGKCFKMRNLYYYGKRRKNWTYKRIIAALGEHVLVDSFELQGDTKLEIQFGEVDYITRFTINTGLIVISEKKYFKEIAQLMNAVKKRGLYGKKSKKV